ncbi:hypothetical protein [Nonomuraea cavernae]|uniref:hypothetical protein n=1 Tax=Nonomuraea cavernae TaxID=2045107 RepID=UPI0033F50D69
MRQRMWDEAELLSGDTVFRIGDMVRPEGGDVVGSVTAVISVPGGYLYSVDIRGTIKRFTERSLVRVQGDPSDPEFWLKQNSIACWSSPRPSCGTSGRPK